MALRVNEINEWVAEVENFSAADIDQPDVLGKINKLFEGHHIIVFRDQRAMTPPDQARFSAAFGPLEYQQNHQYVHPDCEDVLILSNEIRPDGTAVGVVDAGIEWHSDSSHVREPAKATVLLSVLNPKVGGDTWYCNMTAVYASLPPTIQDRIQGLHGVHNSNKLINTRVKVSVSRPHAKEDYERVGRDRDSVLQPIVRTHPETGRPSLYASPRFTIGIAELDDAESQPLLDNLFEYMDDERFQYRHHWQDHDLVMWDNRCLNHRATGGIPAGQIRRMHRTVLAGDEAYFDAGPARARSHAAPSAGRRQTAAASGAPGATARHR